MPRTNRAVEKQAQLAEEMYQKAYGKTEESAPVKVEEGEQEAPSTESAEPEAKATESAPQQNDPNESTEQADAKVEDVKTEENAEEPKPKFPDADPNDKSWEQKYKVIANKYSAEVPRYAAEIRELKAQIKDLEQRLEQKQPTHAPASTNISQEEVDEYGERFVDFVKRAAKEAAGNEDVNGLKQSVEEMRKEQAALGRKRFFDELNGLAPQWQELNENKDFLSFLNELDPYTGEQRATLFDDAYGKLDAWRVANFFNAYSDGQTKEPQQPKPSLEPQVTPKVTGKSAPVQGKKYYNTAEVARFYDDLRRGRYSQEEAARIEQDIFAAQAEGRFRA